MHLVLRFFPKTHVLFKDDQFLVCGLREKLWYVPWPTTDVEKDFIFLNKFLSGVDHICGPDPILTGPDQIRIY